MESTTRLRAARRDAIAYELELHCECHGAPRLFRAIRCGPTTRCQDSGDGCRNAPVFPQSAVGRRGSRGGDLRRLRDVCTGRPRRSHAARSHGPPRCFMAACRAAKRHPPLLEMEHRVVAVQRTNGLAKSRHGAVEKRPSFALSDPAGRNESQRHTGTPSSRRGNRRARRRGWRSPLRTP